MPKPLKVIDDYHPRDLPVKEKTLEEKYADAQAIIRLYESNSPMKAVYALNRKVSELADLLNANSFADAKISDGSDKTFDRLRNAWKDMQEMALALKELMSKTGSNADNEPRDLSLPFVERHSEVR